MQYINEAKRFQKLAGIITESNFKQFEDAPNGSLPPPENNYAKSVFVYGSDDNGDIWVVCFKDQATYREKHFAAEKSIESQYNLEKVILQFIIQPGNRQLTDKQKQILDISNNDINCIPELLKSRQINKEFYFENDKWKDKLLKETYAKGFENNSFYKTSSLDLDHLNLKDKPFSDLRPLPKHINQTAGLIGKTHSIIEDKNKALNAIGYNIPENALEDSVLKFSDRVLNKGIPISKTYDVGLRSITGGSKEYLSPESEITTSGLKEGKPTTEDLFKGETQVRTSSGLRPVSEKEPRIPKEFSEQKIQDIEKILNPEEKRAINLLNRVNFGADPNLVKELYGKEISLVKNLINKVPAPVRAVGKIFGLADVVVETILAAPDVLQGDIEAAKRGSIFGLFGYGKELDEELLEQAKNKESVQRAIQNLKLTPELRNLMEEKKGIEQSLFKGNLDTEQASILSQNLNTIDSRIKEINDYLNKNEYLEEDETNFLNTALNLAKSKAKKAEEMFGPQFKQAQGPTLEQTLFKKILDEGDYSELIPEESKQKIAGTYIPIEIPEIQSPDDSMREGFKKGGISKRDRKSVV
jgi:hypothetical protein